MHVTQPGATSFLELADVPHTYIGAGGKVVSVTVTANGLEFTNGGAGTGATLTAETPTPAVDQTTKVFTVGHAPVFVVSDGQVMTNGNGYSYAAGTLTMDNPPQGFLISFYNA